MVAAVSGSGLGLFNSSLAGLGNQGVNGSSNLGQGGEQIYVNTATGNLVIQHQDDFLASVGLDVGLIRTYNSQGKLDDDNGDNWKIGLYRRVYGLTGTVNTAGSTITKVFGDGAEVTYTYNTSTSRYVSSDGEGAHDTLSYSSSTSQWTWTDGSGRNTEIYDSTGKLLNSKDADGNTVTYTYTGSLLTQVTDASGQVTYLDYTGSNLTQIRVVSSGQTQTLTRYAYDASNRLTSITVDLSPGDNAISDNNTYVTTYTYDSTSKRIASITQKDGTTVSFTYQLINGAYRVKTYTDGNGNVFTLSYSQAATASGTAFVNANQAVLSTTDTQTVTTNYNLNTGLLTTQSAGWSAAALLESSSTATSTPQVAFDSNGNGFAVWAQGGDVYARRYTKATDSWAAQVTLDSNTNTTNVPSLSIDAAGNAIVAWVQSDGTAASAYATRYTVSSGTWSSATLLESVSQAVATSAGSIVASINGANAAVAWLQTNGTVNDLYGALYMNGAWGSAVLLESNGNAVTQLSQAIDGNGNTAVIWQQSDGTANSIYTARYNASTSTLSSPLLLESSSTAASSPSIAYDGNGNGFAVWAQGGDVYARRYTKSTDTWAAQVTLDSNTNTTSVPSLSIDTAGNALVAWVQSDGTAASAYAARYSASSGTWSSATLLETASQAVATGTGGIVASINGANAAVAWLQTNGTVNDLYVARYASGAWGTRTLVESSSNAAAQPAITIDGSGNIAVTWQQSDGTANSIYTARYLANATPYYTIPSSPTWQAIANTLYGVNSAAAGSALQTAMGNPTLVAGNRLMGMPSVLAVTGSQVVTVPAYYTVQSGDTWASVTQTVYGLSDANAVSALQATTGNPTLTAGLHLTVPSVLGYSSSTVTAFYQQTDVTDALGLITTYTTDTQGRLTSVLSPTVNGTRLTTQYAYDASGNVTSITQDPSGLNRVTTFQYDTSGNLLLSRDAAGNTVTRTYSATNQLLTETRYVVADPDGAGSGQPSTPLTTRYAYDSEEHLRFAVSADGRVTEYRYNTAGQRIAQLTYAGAVYDVSALSATTTLSESQLTTWSGTQDLTKLERIDYTYDFRGNVATATAYVSTDSAGAGVSTGSSKTQYVYDQRGQLLQKLTPLGSANTPNASNSSLSYSATYTYDGLGRVLTATDWLASGTTRANSTQYDDVNNKIVTTYANGLVSTVVYDHTGSITSTINSNTSSQALGTTTYAYDVDGRLRMTTDPTGVRQYLIYDEASRKVADIDGNGSLTEYVYNGANQLIKTIHYADALTTTTLATLVDAQGKPTNVTLATLKAALPTTVGRASDQITRNVYDAAGRLVYSIDAVGAVTQYFYDGLSRVTDGVQYTNPVSIASSVGEVLPTQLTTGGTYAITVNATNDRHTRNFYDNDGHLLATLDGAGYLVEYVYNAAGHLTQQIAYANQTNSSYWSTGTLTQLRPATDNETTTDYERDIVSYFFYDGEGRQTGVLDGEGYLTESVYDVDGQVTQTIRYGNVVTYTAGATLASLRPSTGTNRTYSYQYDGGGRLTQETNYEGTITTYSYDAANNLISSTRAQGTSEARTTQTQYDALGRVIKELSGEGSAAIAGGMATATAWDRYGITYTYDLAGRRISATSKPYDSVTSTQQTNTTYYYYNEDNQLRFTVNALGERTEYRYNALGQLTDTISYINRISTSGLTGGLLTSALITTLTASTDATKDAQTTYTYKLTGQLASSLTAAGARTDYAYNAFGNVTTQTVKLDASRNIVSSYTYDTRGLVTQLAQDPSGVNHTETYSYDAFGRRYKVVDQYSNTTKVEYDRLGRTITTYDALNNKHSIAYDAFSRTVSITDALNNVTTYSYNDSTRSATITTPEGISVTTVHNRHGQTLSVTDGRSNQTTYTYDANGALKSSTRAGMTASQAYDSAGRTITTTDANGIVTKLTYDAANRVLTRVVDTAAGGLALTTTYVYDGQGRVTDVTDASGALTRTTYDRDARVTQVAVDPAGLNVRTTYAYDNAGHVITVTEGAGSPNPKVTQYTFDTLGRRTQEAVDPSGLNLRTTYTYDRNNNVVAKTDALSNVTRYVYDADSQLIYRVDATGAVVKNDYDAEGRVVQTTAYANRISLTSPTAFGTTITAADITGRLTTSTANDQIARTVYDKDGRVRFGIDGSNALTEYQYDAANNVIQVTRYATAITVPATVNVTNVIAAIVTNAADQTERTVYDAADRATFNIDAEGYVTQSVYDNVGHVIKQIQYKNALAGTFTANQAPQIVTTAPGSGSYVITNATDDRTTRVIYDAAGRARFGVDGEGYITEYRYDGVGRELKRIQYSAKYTVADGATVASVTAQVPATPGSTDVVTQNQYDAAGRLTTSIDGENVTTLHVYDAADRETDTTVAYGTADASTTHRIFDAAGRLIEETAAYGAAEAATTRYVLDAVGNRLQTIDSRGIELAETDSAWAQATRQSLSYPTLVSGLSTAQKTALRALYTTSQQFDANGRVVTLTDVVSKTITTQYDAFGNIVKVTDQRGNSGYFYFDKNNRSTWQVDPEGYVTQTVYNAFGTADRIVHYTNKVSGTPAVGTLPTVTADAARDQTTLIEHDRRNLTTKITDAENGYETMAYNAFGDKVTYRNKLGGVYTYVFDRVGNVKTETSPSVATTTLDTNGVATTTTQALITEYQYDARGNVTLIREAKGLAQQRDTVITYDRLNREVRRDLPAISVFNPTTKTNSTQTPYTTATYDRRGNIVELRDTAGNRVLSYYDALNRKVMNVDATGTLSEYTYDDVGNLVKERTYATQLNVSSLVWITRPTAVANDTYREMEYVYDANNRRIKAITQSETYFNSAALSTLSNGNTVVSGSGYVTGRITTQSVYDATGNLVKSIDGRGYITLYFYDKLGQQTLSVDPLGYVTRFEYDGNGNLIRQSKYEKKLSNATIATLTENSNQQTLITEVAGQGQDRVTEFDYDRLSRKVAERTLSARYSTVSDTGVLTQYEQALQSTYQYDAAGNITQVIAADGGQTNYDYDVLSRLFREQDPSTSVYNGMSGSTVLTTTARAKTEWQYDALGNRTVQTRFGLTTANDEVTRIRYDAQGHAIAQWDAMSARTDYDVDAKGRILRQSRSATDVDAVAHTYRTYFTYDANDRELSRQTITDEGAGGQVTGETTWSSYNAFGEVSARGINASTEAEYRYDKLGHLFWANADTGTARAYVYDASGNAVIEVSQATGTDLSTLTSPFQVQGIAPSNVQMKFSIYDARNQLTDVFQAPMDYTGLTGALTVTQQQQLANSNNSTPGVMQQTGITDPGATSTGWIYTKSVGSTSYNWNLTEGVVQNGVWTYLDPTAVSQAGQGQDPLSLQPWTTTNTYVDSPTQTRVVTVNRTAYLSGATVYETITTTTDTIITATSSGTTTAADQVNYDTGTATVGQQTTTNTTTTTTSRTVTTTTNTYVSLQVATTTNAVMGGNVTKASQLTYVPPQASVHIYWSNGFYGIYSRLTLSAVNGFGNGPITIYVEDGAGGGYWAQYYDTYQALNWFAVARLRMWKGGVQIFDTASNPTAYFEFVDAGGIQDGFYTTPAITVTTPSGAGIGYVGTWLSNGQSAWLSYASSAGGYDLWAATGIGAAGTNWQYNLYDGGWNLYGAVWGDNTSNPGSRVYYCSSYTQYDYYRSKGGDDYIQYLQKVDVGQAIQQSNYLRQLVYSVASGTAQSNQIHRSNTYDAFGDVLSQTDGRGNVTQYTYNELGVLLRKQDPAVDYTGEDGVKVTNFTPVTQYYVDALGQTIGMLDANSYLTKQAIRNMRQTALFNPDGGTARYYYDIFGNLAAVTSAMGLTTRYTYDKDNRQTRSDFAGGNYDVYEYDALGNRVTHTNGLGNRETYKYDAEGRITRYRSAENRQTSYSYTFRTDIGERGGYRKVTTDPLLNTMVDDVDMFGKVRSHTDMGGHVYTYTYNNAGWLTKQTSTAGQNIDYTYFNNGYVKEIKDSGVGSYAFFEYDKDGNRTLESYAAQSVIAGEAAYGLSPYQMARATYDALNRVVSIEETGKYKIEYEYDKASNRRRVKSTYYDLLTNTQQVQDFWYKYDSMNRFTTTMGQLVGGQIVRGSTGYDITYNTDSQRATQASTDSSGKAIKETYAYDGNGFLTTVKINPDAANVAGDGVVRAQRVNNVVGDKTDYYEFNAASVATSRHHYTYDKDHLLTQDHDIDNNRGTNYTLLVDGRTDKTVSYNNADANAAIVTFQYTYDKWDTYQQKVITVTGIANGVSGWRNGTSTFTYDVNGHVNQVYDHAEDRTIQYMNNQNGQTLKRREWSGTNTSVAPIVTRSFYYLYGKPVGDQGTDKVASRVDYAQTLQGTELEGNGNKTYIESKRWDVMSALWQQWMQGGSLLQWNLIYNNQGNAQQSQHKDIGTRVDIVSSADFDQNFQPINPGYPGSTGSTYVVRTGDTLRSIAASVWGDSSLWYIIADANGLNGSETLVADMRLTLPNVVTNIHNNATTFRPVDPSLALGDTSPTLPDPPPPPSTGKGGSGCGVLGMIILVIVAIIVTIYTAGAASASIGAALGTSTAAVGTTGTMALGASVVAGTAAATVGTTAMIAGAVIGGAVGAIASQGLAIAFGMQSGFDWKGVALGAIGAGVGAGVGALASGSGSLSWMSKTNSWSGVGAQMARGAVTNAAVQGVSMAAGLQQKFSWTQVAASAVGSGVGSQTSNWLAGELSPSANTQFMAGFGGSLVNGAAYAAVSGEKPNWGMIAANSFGSALGNSIVENIQASELNRRARSLLEKAGLESDKTNHRSSLEFAANLASLGATDGEALLILNNSEIRSGLEDNNTARADGISDELASTRAESAVDAWQRGDMGVGDLEEIVVTAPSTNGPGGETIAQKVFSGGVHLVEGLTQLEADHPVLAGLAFEAGKGLLTGGPLKTIVTKLAKTTFDGAVGVVRNELSGLAQTTTEQFITDLAQRNNISIDLKIAGVDVTIGPDAFGMAAGQVAGGAVDTLFDAKLNQITERGRNIRNTIPHETGEYGTLKRGDIPGDGLDNHHVPQKAVARDTVPGYPQDKNALSAPAIRLSEAEHRKITSIQASNEVARRSMTPRELVADDARMLRSIGVDNARIRELIDSSKQKYGLGK